jgi:SAM-dependent methyltransferase
MWAACVARDTLGVKTNGLTSFVAAGINRCVTPSSVPGSLPMSATDDTIVAELRARSSVSDSLVYAHLVYAEVDGLVRRYGGRSGSILEIGPGANLGALFCFVASDYTNVAGVDIAAAEPPATGFYSSLRDYLSCVGSWRWWRQFATASFPNVTFPTLADRFNVEDALRQIDYRAPVSSAALPFADQSFDVVFSVAALEHVADPGATVAEVRRILKPGGLAIHEIDLVHHGSADPLKFLEWEEDEWCRRSERYGDARSQDGLLEGNWGQEVYCNRLRHSEWLTLFGDGLECLHNEPIMLYDPSEIDPTRFVEPFRSKSPGDLSVLAFRIVARKPAS